MNNLSQTIASIISSYSLDESIVLLYGYGKLLIRNRLPLKNSNHERFVGFLFDFPFRPAFFGLINEIFFRPFVSISKNSKPVLIIDCGTNIGVRMLYLKWTYPNAHFMCFEPNDVVLPFLQKNITQNNLTNSVVLHTIALGKNDGVVDFFYNENVRASGSATVVKPSGSSQVVVKQVQQKRLSSFIHEEVELLKIDIEGVEGDVIEDLVEHGTFQFIRSVLIEYHFDGVTMTYPLETMILKLEHAGYVCTHSPLEVFRQKTAGPVLRTCMIYAEKKS